MLIRADARALPLKDESVDSVVTDPPYELGFMGKAWDKRGVAFDPAMWAEVLRVMKPGAHLLAFGGSRTFHRITCAIEDAGFEIRDCMMWLYGSGFPKSLDVSKAIDKEAGAEREVVGKGRRSQVASDGWDRPWKHAAMEASRSTVAEYALTAPATPAARQWSGWGTALKPAFEPIILARKPLSESTVAKNVLKWGTGAVNVDGGRIVTSDDTRRNAQGGDNGLLGASTFRIRERKADDKPQPSGRWPANVLLDEEAAGLLDEMSGERTSGALKPYQESHTNASSYQMSRAKTFVKASDSGGASRFFYTAKASPAERGKFNDHPTVKPVALMQYLCRLITPPGGVILDMFCGSGSTCRAAIAENFEFIGSDLSAEYLGKIAKRRITNVQRVLKAVGQ